jgi:hypothetical protein
MKKAFRVLQIASCLTFLVTAGLLLTGVISFADIGMLIPQGITMAAAGAGVSISSGTPTTHTAADATPTLLLNTINQNITKMKPAATPLDTIIRSSPKNIPSPSWKYDFYAVDMRGVEDTVSETLDVSAGTVGAYNLKVTNLHQYQKDDNITLIAVEGVDHQDVVCNITAKNIGGGYITITPLNGFGTATKELTEDVLINTKICRMGNAKSELDAQTDPYTIFPEKSWNYNQIHMCQVEESVFLELHKKEVGYGMADYKYAALYDYRRGIEIDSLWGVRKLIVDATDSEEKYFTGGVTRFIDQYLTFDTTETSRAKWSEFWNAWMKAIFSDNSGSDTRTVFIGKDLMERLNNIDSVQRQIDAKSTAMVHGITFNRIESNFGILDLKLHNLFAPMGWADKAIVLDMPNIEKFTYKAMETKKLSLIDSGQRNANAYKIDETFGLALRYPKTHAIISGVEGIPEA